MVHGPPAQSAGSGGPWPPYEVEADAEKGTAAVASNQTPAAAAAVENEVAEVDSGNDTPLMMETKKVVVAGPEPREHGDGHPCSLDLLVPRSADS